MSNYNYAQQQSTGYRQQAYYYTQSHSTGQKAELLKEAEQRRQFLSMCHQAKCGTCNKVTWWGCGNHIPGVMSNVPAEQWCVCEPKVERGGTQYPPKGSLGR